MNVTHKPWSPVVLAVWMLLMAWVCTARPAVAQDAVYRCGQEYTNAPQDKTRCMRVSTQAAVVIEGTRPAGQGARTSAALTAPVGTTVVPDERTKTEPVRPDATQRERDAQARAIVVAELDKARQQQAQLLTEYNQGEPVKWASESRNHQKYLDRVAALKAAMDRNERDIDSLQRELARRPVATNP